MKIMNGLFKALLACRPTNYFSWFSPFLPFFQWDPYISTFSLWDKQYQCYLDEVLCFTIFCGSDLVFLSWCVMLYILCLQQSHGAHYILFHFLLGSLSLIYILHLTRNHFSFQIQGPHLLAPTGSDLRCYGHEGTVFAGYHYDLNFLTIHGRSRFPGLNIWLRNGQKVEVKVPVGCLLIQTGKQVRM